MKPIKLDELEKKYKELSYSDKELEMTEELQEKVNKALHILDNLGIKYEKFDLSDIPKLKLKKAYPNYDDYIPVPSAYDVNKWLFTVKDIFYKQKLGNTFSQALKIATKDWQVPEVYDFLSWFRFYEEGTQMKYKTAQHWSEKLSPGYYLPFKRNNDLNNASVIPQAAPPEVAIPKVEPVIPMVQNNDEKKQIIERQRQKIIGRLDSAEKLLRTQEGQTFAGNELENLMEAIYTLKKKVQLVNKLSSSVRLYEDMIIREGNVLSRKGFMKAAGVLYKVADEVPKDAPPEINQAPSDPTGAGDPGLPGQLPANPPGVPSAQTHYQNDGNGDQPPISAIKAPPQPPDSTLNGGDAIMPQEQPKGIKEFIQGMNEGQFTDNLEVSDADDLMVSEAQAINPPVPTKEVPLTTTPPASPLDISPIPEDVPAPITTELPPVANIDESEPLEVSEEDIPKTNMAVPEDVLVKSLSDFDNKVDEVFDKVTVADVIEHLEGTVKIYKNRELPRRLSYTDMMLNSLGLSALFPALSEAQSKALESNNYVLTRLEDILSNLRGVMATKDVDLHTGKTTNLSPDAENIKNRLEQDNIRKQQKKQRQEAADNKETPNVDIQSDLATSKPKIQ